MNEGKEKVEPQEERGPVTFKNPLKQKEKMNAKDRDCIVTWIVRGMAFLAEVLFFLPLCVVSCSSQPDSDKIVTGPEVVFGFKLSYLEDSVVGIWWFVFVFLLTALIVVLWYLKDMNRLKDFKLRKFMLCFGTGIIAIINVIIMSCFIHVANLRIKAANEGFAIGEASIRFTFGFGVLMFIQILLALGGVAALVWIIIENRQIVGALAGVVKRRISKNKANKKQNTDRHIKKETDKDIGNKIENNT